MRKREFVVAFVCVNSTKSREKRGGVERRDGGQLAGDSFLSIPRTGMIAKKNKLPALIISWGEQSGELGFS